MRIQEFADTETQKLYAISEFLLGRADDTDTQKSISIPAFIGMARSIGLNLTDQSLRDLATKPPLNKIIVNVTDDSVIFAGAGEATKVTDKMTVSQAQDTVAKMADRANEI